LLENDKMMRENHPPVSLLDVLASVLELKGQRELIERLLQVYGDNYPQDVAEANQISEVINSIEPPDDPLTAKRGIA